MAKKKSDGGNNGLNVHQARILRVLRRGQERTLIDLARDVGFKGDYSKEWLHSLHYLAKKKLLAGRMKCLYKITTLGKRYSTNHDKTAKPLADEAR